MISDEYLALLAGPDDVDGDLRSQLRELAVECQQLRTKNRRLMASAIHFSADTLRMVTDGESGILP